MSTDRGLLRQALEALELAYAGADAITVHGKAITAIRAALEQPEPEPVAIHQWRKRFCAEWYDGYADHEDGGGPYEERILYTHPPQKEQHGNLSQGMELLRQRHRNRGLGA
jgi:delta-aminolevulinic acid dehydratase/porphobilinogen synthase